LVLAWRRRSIGLIRAYGLWSLVFGLWSLVFGFGALGFGLWPLAIVSYVIETPNRQSAIKNLKSKI